MTAMLASKRAREKPPRLAAEVLAWWDVNRRDLPWRAAPGMVADPYRVWLSEVLLQQTTVAAATPYFLEFIRRWPDVASLAAAPLGDVMAAFAGLGYYSRARNLHACAKAVAARGGQFPQSDGELRALPGLGAYTAAAVAAIAFGARSAPVDGNVARIYARLHAVEAPLAKARAKIAAIAASEVPEARPGDFAQALMDLGAIVCRPRNPACGACPVSARCAANAAGAPEAYPRKSAKPPRPIRHGVVFFACRADGAFLARRRPPEGLLGATLELPGTAWQVGQSPDPRPHMPFAAAWRAAPGLVTQAFTHFELRLEARVAAVPAGFEGVAGALWIAPDDVASAGFSSVMRKAVEHAARQWRGA